MPVVLCFPDHRSLRERHDQHGNRVPVDDVLPALAQGVCGGNKLGKRPDDQRCHRGDCAADGRMGNSVVLRYFFLGAVPSEVLQSGGQRVPEAENWRLWPHSRFKSVFGNSVAQIRDLSLGESGGMIHADGLFLVD